ncbi:MAG TPA: GlsB/YeaQ/YmgE family stress response membrane protein [Anaerolineales bacterium]|nr:GlsB/YeaQ/YmgE family stress response membrane protein [Anaerolineales bacterium]HNN14374.1 GlsB/YeaQ/YmgE family stress response membrane protein [Anaerolineales bacterium]
MTLTDILIWIVFGALAGWIASIITGRNKQMGAVENVLSGIAGAFIGGFIMENFFGTSGVTGFNFYSLIVAILGAVVLIWIIGFFRGGRRRRR